MDAARYYCLTTPVLPLSDDGGANRRHHHRSFRVRRKEGGGRGGGRERRYYCAAATAVAVFDVPETTTTTSLMKTSLMKTSLKTRRMSSRRVVLWSRDHHRHRFPSILMKAAPKVPSGVATETNSLLGKWAVKTQSLAELATVPLLAVTLPQIVLNQQNIIAGNSHLLAGISYEGYACGCLGNMLLLSYFSAIDEPAGRNIQAIGVVNTVFLLSQLFFTGNCGDVNLLAYGLCVSVALFGVVSAYFKKQMFADETMRKKTCALYERGVGVFGYTFVPYILSHALFRTSMDFSQLLSLGAFAMISLRCANDYFGWSEKKNVNFFALEQFMRLKWQTLMGWTATLLFSLLPIAQISTSTTDPTNIASLSLVAVVLGGAGNALMFARAWHIRDWCWSLGSFGGSSVGSWGVLLTMFNYGHKQVPLGVFAALSVLHWGWVAFVIWYDDKCKKKPMSA